MKDSGYFTMTDGTDIYYRRMGAGEPVLFLHGNGGSSRFFKYQVPSFEPYFQLIFLWTVAPTAGAPMAVRH